MPILHSTAMQFYLKVGKDNKLCIVISLVSHTDYGGCYNVVYGGMKLCHLGILGLLEYCKRKGELLCLLGNCRGWGFSI